MHVVSNSYAGGPFSQFQFEAIAKLRDAGAQRGLAGLHLSESNNTMTGTGVARRLFAGRPESFQLTKHG